MNARQTKLYQNLLNLVQTNEAFYFVDQILDDKVYRIFTYRLASFTDFLNADALECRGHMFEVTEEGANAKPVRLACWTLSKFFNKDENPMAMNLDFESPKQIMLKMDGSLISTFLHNGMVRMKSKASLFSDQAVAAQKLFDNADRDFKRDIKTLEDFGKTIIMEYTAPDNRIVIGYETPALTILGVRDRVTGDFMQFDSMPLSLKERWVDRIDVPGDKVVEFVNSIPNMTGIEGYVLQLKNNQFIKIKTIAYLTLHHAKDSVNSPRRLFETVLEEASDDLRSLFAGDPVVIKQIQEMEEKVDKLYNHLVKTVEDFYAQNKQLDRKSYAIKATADLTRMEFGCAMNLYLGRSVPFKDVLKSRWKDLGFSDKTKEAE